MQLFRKYNPATANIASEPSTNSATRKWARMRKRTILSELFLVVMILTIVLTQVAFAGCRYSNFWQNTSITGTDNGVGHFVNNGSWYKQYHIPSGFKFGLAHLDTPRINLYSNDVYVRVGIVDDPDAGQMSITSYATCYFYFDADHGGPWDEPKAATYPSQGSDAWTDITIPTRNGYKPQEVHIQVVYEGLTSFWEMTDGCAIGLEIYN